MCLNGSPCYKMPQITTHQKLCKCILYGLLLNMCKNQSWVVLTGSENFASAALWLAKVAALWTESISFECDSCWHKIAPKAIFVAFWRCSWGWRCSSAAAGNHRDDKSCCMGCRCPVLSHFLLCWCFQAHHLKELCAITDSHMKPTHYWGIFSHTVCCV